MTAQATVEWRSIGDLPHARQLVIDCAHGTTTISVSSPPGAVSIPDELMVAMAVDRHESEERCGCVSRIRASGGRA